MKYLVLALTLVTTSPAWAYNDFIDSLNKKSSVKKKTRWTLSDWLSTKKKVSLMDSWLAVNTSASIFEYYGGATKNNFQDTLVSDPDNILTEGEMNSYVFAGFLTIFGFKVEQESFDSQEINSVDLLLRIMGKSEQSTRLNLIIGGESVDDNAFTEKYDRTYYGAELRVYLLPFLAVDGRYQQFQEGELPNATVINGNKVEYGVSLDIGPLQLFGLQTTTTNEFQGGADTQREGMKYGFRIYL